MVPTSGPAGLPACCHHSLPACTYMAGRVHKLVEAEVDLACALGVKRTKCACSCLQEPVVFISSTTAE